MQSEREQLEAALREINEALRSGITSVTTDGTTTTVDLDQLRTERRDIEKKLQTMRKPTAATFDLSGGV